MSKKLAILIDKKYHSVPTSKDNDLLYDSLLQFGLDYELVIWDQENIVWEQYLAVLIRGTWDYIEKKEQFLSVLRAIVRKAVMLFNPFELVKWNCIKDYLLDLKKNNIKIIDSLILSISQVTRLDTFIQKYQSEDFVVKPLVSAGGHRTFRVKAKNIPTLLQKNFKANERVIIQPFFEEIMQGEWSLIFFNNCFSMLLYQNLHSMILKYR